MNAALRNSHAIHLKGEFERAATEIALREPQRAFRSRVPPLAGGSGGRSDARTPLFPNGLAAFLCLGFPRLEGDSTAVTSPSKGIEEAMIEKELV